MCYNRQRNTSCRTGTVGWVVAPRSGVFWLFCSSNPEVYLFFIFSKFLTSVSFFRVRFSVRVMIRVRVSVRVIIRVRVRFVVRFRF